jgi:uncharacterized membrane protein YhdT
MKEMDKEKGISKEDFIEDPRYKQCNKEAIYACILGVINVIWWYAWGYGLGSKPVSEYKYLMGFPDWFFMSSVLGAILFTLLTFLMIDKLFKHMPLEKMNEEEAKKYIEELK